MHDVRVTMKDGTVHCGPLWTWRPDLGWFTLAGEPGPDTPIRLAEVESAIQHGVRRRPPTEAGPLGLLYVHTDIVDLVERARNEGWNGS